MAAEGYSCIAINENNIRHDISDITISDSDAIRHNIQYAVMLRPVYDSSTGKKTYIKRVIYRKN